MHGPKNVFRNRIIFTLVFISKVITANALQINTQLDFGVEYSDNITRSDVVKISDYARVYGLIFNLNHQSKNVALNIEPRLVYRDYDKEIIDDQLYEYLDASLLWQIVPRNIIFTIEDYVDQAPIDIFAPSTPFNLQTTNVAIGGPDFIINFNSTQRMELIARYADFYYEISNTDNKRYGARLSLISEPKQSSKYSVNLDSVDINYEEFLVNEDYKRHDGYLQINKEHINLDYEILAGYTNIDREVSEDKNGELFSLSMEIEASSRSVFILLGYSQYTDSSRNFLLSRAYQDYIRRFDTAVTSEIFLDRYLFAGYRWSNGLMSIETNISTGKEDYDLGFDPLDRKIDRLRLNLRRNISNLAAIYANTEWRYTDYRNTNRKDDDVDLIFGASYLLSRSLYLTTEYRRFQRDSTFEFDNYIENIGYINITYRSGR